MNIYNCLRINSSLTKLTRICVRYDIDSYKYTVMGYTWTMERNTNIEVYDLNYSMLHDSPKHEVFKERIESHL